MYSPERNTRDLDIIIVPAVAADAHEKLRKAGWSLVSSLSIGSTSWRSSLGEEVDVLEGLDPWWPEAIRQAQSNRDVQNLPITPLPYLVLMKFQSSRTMDIADITRMLGQCDADQLDQIRRLFAQYESDGLDDLESLIQLGQLEMQ
jgi:hypothetical protein